MRISICGSMTFAKEMIEAKKKLENNGHEVIVPLNIEKYMGILKIENKWEKLEYGLFRRYFKEIKNPDAVLIINKDKNNIKNYVGGDSLIEMAFAHVLNKKIFLLDPTPIMNYSDEIEAMKPIILNGNLNLIK